MARPPLDNCIKNGGSWRSGETEGERVANAVKEGKGQPSRTGRNLGNFTLFFSDILSIRRNRALTRDPLDRTKVVLRHFPPWISQALLMEQVDSRFTGRYRWAAFSREKSAISTCNMVELISILKDLMLFWSLLSSLMVIFLLMKKTLNI